MPASSTRADPSAANGPPELTLRAVATGMVVGAILSLCNLYAGLKTSWTLNMSIVAALLGTSLWQSLARLGIGRRWGLLENNINQTAASAAAAMPSAGLVAAVPALTLVTGTTMSWIELVVWTATVSVFGVAVAGLLRRQLVIDDALPFPFGVAIAETVRELYGSAQEAAARTRWFFTGALAGAASAWWIGAARLGRIPLPGSLSISGGRSVTAANLGFALDPSALMVAVGALVGMRIGLSLLLGAGLGWGVLALTALDSGWAQAGGAGADTLWYGALNRWTLWPAVSLTVTSSITGFAWSVARRGPSSLASAWHVLRGGRSTQHWLYALLVGSGGLAIAAQTLLFEIPPLASLVAVLLTFALAMVAARVSGETGVSPVGSMGKVTQLVFGAITPGHAAANLMAANVTAGAANQCADMMDDLKSGQLLGASPARQAVAQLAGVMSGALVACAMYVVLIPDPASDLLTETWPAPAAASWKAVAELLAGGWSALPEGALRASGWCAALGVLLASAERLIPARWGRWLPSGPSMGLAMLIPAFYSISAALGAALAGLGRRGAPRWTDRFAVVVAAGLIAGESLAGFAGALGEVLGRAMG